MHACNMSSFLPQTPVTDKELNSCNQDATKQPNRVNKAARQAVFKL